MSEISVNSSKLAAANAEELMEFYLLDMSVYGTYPPYVASYLKSHGLYPHTEPEDAAESLDKLISLGWIQESQGEIRLLTMHPLVQEVVWGELKPDGENCIIFLILLDDLYDPNGAYSARRLEQMAETFARAAAILPTPRVLRDLAHCDSKRSLR